jgi:hypothetical protein
VVSEYDQHIDDIRAQIYDLKILRDAQREGSTNWERFQREINDLTSVLFEWRDAAAGLEKVDSQIRLAERRVSAARQRADDDEHATWRVAKVLGVAGIVFLLISVTWMPSVWFPVLTALCLGGSVAAIMYGTRVRRDRSEVVENADAALSVLREQRRRQLPTQGGARWDMTVADTMPLEGLDLEGVDVD